MTTFKKFTDRVRMQWDSMKDRPLFFVNVDPDILWQKYLDSFIDEYNPIFRERKAYDCSCCRNFIKNIGPVITLEQGKVKTIWEVEVGEPYQSVAKELDKYVRNLYIKNKYLTEMDRFGTEKNRDNKEDITWYHFNGKVPSRIITDDKDSIWSRYKSTYDVFKRGLDTIDKESINTVHDLIEDNLLYRGEEYLSDVKAFSELMDKYRKINNPQQKDYFLWENVDNPAAKFKNKVIGTLVFDLAEGTDLETAVKKFEAKVAPENYKRPKALITPKMVNEALKTLDRLGLRDSIDRRHATLEDVSTTDIIWADASAKSKMKDNLQDLLMSETKTKAPDFKNIEEISIKDFIDTVVPKTETMEMKLDYNHLNNFVSITAPKNECKENLFKWGNDFAWSYDGEVTDSIKERVKKAGGRVDNAILRFSLSWSNSDDLDIHVYEPNGNHIFFSNKGGKLDVDMNAFDITPDPVENVSYMTKPQDGKYRVTVHNYCKRTSSNKGWTLELESASGVHQYHSEINPQNQYSDQGLMVTVKGGVIQEVKRHKESSLKPIGMSVKEKWNIKTNTMVKVDTLMYSPNHWHDKSEGNKHYFFILRDCKNPDPVRGIYNEFLSPKLHKDRKVFEVLGSKTKCEYSDNQLSGVGFSSTKPQSFEVLTKGDGFSKVYKVKV